MRNVHAGAYEPSLCRRTPLRFDLVVGSALPWCLALGVSLGASRAHAEPPWRSVRGPDLPATFIDHELADGVHYAYQFRADGTFTGVSMGKEITGTWHSTGGEFCWTRKKRGQQEECFEVERRGDEVRFLRDGYAALSARLLPLKGQAFKDQRP